MTNVIRNGIPTGNEPLPERTRFLADIAHDHEPDGTGLLDYATEGLALVLVSDNTSLRPNGEGPEPRRLTCLDVMKAVAFNRRGVSVRLATNEELPIEIQEENMEALRRQRESGDVTRNADLWRGVMVFGITPEAFNLAVVNTIKNVDAWPSRPTKTYLS